MRSHSLTHRFVLEAAEVAETPRTTVATQLLGPHTVRSANGLSPNALGAHRQCVRGIDLNRALRTLCFTAARLYFELRI